MLKAFIEPVPNTPAGGGAGARLRRPSRSRGPRLTTRPRRSPRRPRRAPADQAAQAGTGGPIAAPEAPPAPKKGIVTVIVENVESDSGTVNVAVCDKALSREGCPYHHEIQAARGFVETEFDDIPPGTYAVVSYHDVNGNRRVRQVLRNAARALRAERRRRRQARAEIQRRGAGHKSRPELRHHPPETAGRLTRPAAKALARPRPSANPPEMPPRSRCNITATLRNFLFLRHFRDSTLEPPHGIRSREEAGIWQGRLCCRTRRITACRSFWPSRAASARASCARSTSSSWRWRSTARRSTSATRSSTTATSSTI